MRNFEIGVVEVEVKAAQLRRGHERLVTYRSTRHGRDIEAGQRGVPPGAGLVEDAVLDARAHQEQKLVKLQLGAHGVRALDQYLLDIRQCLKRTLAQHVRLVDDGAPHQRFQVIALQFVGDDRARLCIQSRVARQEQHAQGDVAGAVCALADPLQFAVDQRVRD